MASVVLAWCVGCSGASENSASLREAIVNPASEATAYPEAVRLYLYIAGSTSAGGLCSGSIIAPKVVLTAGHCVNVPGMGMTTGVDVMAPYNGPQKLHASQGLVLDFDGTYNTHDVGLFFLDTAATLSASQCPVLAQTPVPDGSNVVNIGAIDNNSMGTTETLWVGAPVSVMSGANCFEQYAYCAQDIIEEGDSGGPVEVPGTTPHEIVAVNSANMGTSAEAMSRVDLVHDWIEQQIQQHGGSGPCTGAASGDSGGGSSGGGSGSSSGSGTSSGTSGSGSNSGSGAGSGSSNGATGSPGDSGAGSGSSGGAGAWGGGGWNGASRASGGCRTVAGEVRSESSVFALGLVAGSLAVVRRKRPHARGKQTHVKRRAQRQGEHP